MLNFCLVGNANVGKTNIINSFLYNMFSITYFKTFGPSQYSTKDYSKYIFDLPGDEYNLCQYKHILQNIDIIVLCYACDDRNSFDNIQIS